MIFLSRLLILLCCLNKCNFIYSEEMIVNEVITDGLAFQVKGTGLDGKEVAPVIGLVSAGDICIKLATVASLKPLEYLFRASKVNFSSILDPDNLTLILEPMITRTPGSYKMLSHVTFESKPSSSANHLNFEVIYYLPISEAQTMNDFRVGDPFPIASHSYTIHPTDPYENAKTLAGIASHFNAHFKSLPNLPRTECNLIKRQK